MQRDHHHIGSLRDVTAEILQTYRSALDDTIFNRAHHVVSENARVLEASDALWYKDHDLLGRLLDRSHESLQREYEVSSTELDAMADICRSVKGVYGARMVGAGFGGSVLALSTPEASPLLREMVMRDYPSRTGIDPNVLSCRTAGGARAIRLR